MPFSVRVLNESDWASAGADLVQRMLRLKPQALLSFPTGRTPLPLYSELRRRASAGEIDASALRAVMLDDYAGAAALPSNFYNWLRRELFDPLGLSDDRLLRIPSEPAAGETMAGACARFERQLQSWGGCDLQFLGLGGNGHIGFNDPGATADSRTRVVELAPETARANAEYWHGSYVPERAVTMGIATILSAHRICLLVRGRGKAEALLHTLTGSVGPALPASFLQTARDEVLVLADAEAGALLPAALRRPSSPPAAGALW